ncbi:MAG: DUF1214 domain-containing protein [Deltaproteobacteria bacterium]
MRELSRGQRLLLLTLAAFACHIALAWSHEAITNDSGSYLRLAEDEALIVEVIPPKVRYWNFTLSARWHEIVDYLDRPTSLTIEDVEYESDNSVRFVISHSDPGHPNWLDTSGHDFGFMTFRWIDGKGQQIAMPTDHIVKVLRLWTHYD